MLSADRIKVESDERGFELHILDDEGDWHVFNIHGVALEFYDEVRDKIGEWAAAAATARAEVARGVTRELLEREPGESAEDYWQRTGDAEPLREAGDIARKTARESA
jgi:hypothetical protein